MATETYTNAPLVPNNEADLPQAVNDAVNAIGTALDAPLTVALTSNAATVSAAQLKGAGVLVITGTLTGAGTVTVAACNKKFVVKNATTGAYALTVKVSGQTGVVVQQGAEAALRCNGTDVVRPGATGEAYTDSYGSSSRALSAITASDQSAAYTSTAVLLADAATLVDLNTLRSAYELERADAANLRALLSGLIADLKAAGIIA